MYFTYRTFKESGDVIEHKIKTSKIESQRIKTFEKWVERKIEITLVKCLDSWSLINKKIYQQKRVKTWIIRGEWVRRWVIKW